MHIFECSRGENQCHRNKNLLFLKIKTSKNAEIWVTSSNSMILNILKVTVINIFNITYYSIRLYLTFKYIVGVCSVHNRIT